MSGNAGKTDEDRVRTRADDDGLAAPFGMFGPDPLANDQDAALYNCMASGVFGAYGENLFY